MFNLSSPPKISVITAVRNGGLTLEKAIQSLLAQSYPHLEYIIIDGGSTDNTLDIIKKYHTHITYWHSKPDKGAAEAVNIGIEKATGDIICFLNADDWYEPKTLTLVAEAFLQHPHSDMITCGCRIVEYCPKTKDYKTTLSFTQARQLELTFKNICFGAVVPNCRFFKPDFFKKVGLFLLFDNNEKPLLSCDKDFFLRAITLGVKNVFIHHLGYTHLAHIGSATFSLQISNIKRLYREHMFIAEKFLNLENMTDENKRLLQQWYDDQSVRLLLRELLSGKAKESLKIAQDSFQKYGFRWIKALFSTPLQIVLNKLYAYLPPVTGTIAPER